MTNDLKLCFLGEKYTQNDPKNMTSVPTILTSDPKIMQNKATNFKITGPTGIFGENRDIKTVIRDHLITI